MSFRKRYKRLVVFHFRQAHDKINLRELGVGSKLIEKELK